MLRPWCKSDTYERRGERSFFHAEQFWESLSHIDGESLSQSCPLELSRVVQECLNSIIILSTWLDISWEQPRRNTASVWMPECHGGSKGVVAGGCLSIIHALSTTASLERRSKQGIFMATTCGFISNLGIYPKKII